MMRGTGDQIPVPGWDVVWHPRKRGTGEEISAHGWDEIWHPRVKCTSEEIPASCYMSGGTYGML